jgi:Flp pilus assembly pilin Flp
VVNNALKSCRPSTHAGSIHLPQSPARKTLCRRSPPLTVVRNQWLLRLRYGYFGDSRYCPRMVRQIKLFLRGERGATAIEHSIMAGGIAVAIIVTVYGIGPNSTKRFRRSHRN